jgi:serine/threonine protein phosphatase PrpC
MSPASRSPRQSPKGSPRSAAPPGSLWCDPDTLQLPELLPSWDARQVKSVLAHSRELHWAHACEQFAPPASSPAAAPHHPHHLAQAPPPTRRIEIPVVLDLSGTAVLAVGNPVNWAPGIASAALAARVHVLTVRFDRRQPRRRGSVHKEVTAARQMSAAGVRCFVSDARGVRSRMEDRFVLFSSTTRDAHPVAVFAVFDGHSGDEAAELVSAHLRQLFERYKAQSGDLAAVLEAVLRHAELLVCEEMLRLGCEAGCTALLGAVCLSRLFLANVGDSRAVLSRGGRPVALTRDHRPSDPEEAARIAGTPGAFVSDGYVDGLIAVARALGDVQVVTGRKLVGLDARPDLFSVPLAAEAGEDEYLILACDGLWDFLSMDGALEVVRRSLRTFRGDWKRAADELVTHALQRSDDNVTVVLVQLEGRGRFWERAGAEIKPDGSPKSAARPRLEISGLSKLAGLLR